MPAWPVTLPSGRNSVRIASGPPIPTPCRLNSRSGTVSFQNVSVPSSITTLPRSPVTSRRLLPGASPVPVTNTPVAPLGYSTNAVTSSSTSIA